MNDSADQNQSLSFWASVFTIVVCALFGANAVAIKFSLTGLGTFTTAGIRFGVAALIIFLWAKVTNHSFGIDRRRIPKLLIASLIFTFQLSLFYFGISKTNASRGTLLVNLQPFFILFLAHFFIPGDRITIRKLSGLLLGFSGVAFVFLEKKGITADLQTGDFIILFASFIWACNGIYTKKLLNDFEPFHLVFYPMLFSAPVFILEAFLWDPVMVTRIDGEVLVSMFYQTIVTAAFGFVAWMTLLRKYGAVALHSFTFVMPIAGVFLGGTLLKEPITAKIITALGLIVAGLLVIHLKRPIKVPIIHMGRNV
jgi:drug/metabolite transporter (DMT)-like permease